MHHCPNIYGPRVSKFLRSILKNLPYEKVYPLKQSWVIFFLGFEVRTCSSELTPMKIIVLLPDISTPTETLKYSQPKYFFRCSKAWMDVSNVQIGDLNIVIFWYLVVGSEEIIPHNSASLDGDVIFLWSTRPISRSFCYFPRRHTWWQEFLPKRRVVTDGPTHGIHSFLLIPIASHKAGAECQEWEMHRNG